MLTGSHIAHDICPQEDVTDLTRRYCKPGQPVAPAELRSVADVAPFAMAAYGTLYYVYVNRQPLAIANFCCRAFCGCCGDRRDGAAAPASGAPQSPGAAIAAAAATEGAGRRRGGFGLELDPTRVLTKAAVSAIAGVPPSDVRHLSSVNSFNEQAPYFIALHRSSRSVVVSVRGTFRWAQLLRLRPPVVLPCRCMAGMHRVHRGRHQLPIAGGIPPGTVSLSGRAVCVQRWQSAQTCVPPDTMAGSVRLVRPVSSFVTPVSCCVQP